MKPVQYILLIVIALIIARSGRKLAKKQIHFQDFLLYVIFWAFPVVIVIWPSLTQRLAELIGIGRGVDLIVYISILVLFFLFFQLLSGQKELEERLTKMGREVALREAKDLTAKNDKI